MKNILLSSALLLSGVLIAQNFTEEFVDSISVANAGWLIDNNSGPNGSTSWFPGNSTVFPAYSQNGYYAANYNNTLDSGTISTWLISPNRWYQNGDSIIFYTRTTDSGLIPRYPDRMQVRFSQNSTSSNTGVNPTDLGDFTMQLLEINATYDTICDTLLGYPCDWKRYMIVLSGLPGPGVSGRFAFRYFVEDGGPLGSRSDYIGIDSCAYRSITNSIDEQESYTLSIYPNPAASAGIIHIQAGNELEEFLLTLFDVSGREIFRMSFINKPEGLEFILPEINPGFYYMRIKGQNGSTTKNLVIK